MRFSCCASLRAAHLHARAPGHNAAPLLWGPYPQSEEDHCPIPLPTLIDGTSLWQQPGFSLQRSSSWGCHFWGRQASLGEGLTRLLNSNRVQGDGGPSWRWVTDVHVGPGCLPGWEVKHGGAVPSASHGCCGMAVPPCSHCTTCRSIHSPLQDYTDCAVLKMRESTRIMLFFL